MKFPKFLAAAAVFYAVIMILSTLNILNGYFMIIINKSLIFVILAVSLNLINGITGQFSLGHMGFAGIGAYVSGTITAIILKLQIPHSFSMGAVGSEAIFIGAIIIGGIMAAFVGFLIGFPSLRLKGDYLAIVTLGFGEIIKTIINAIDYVGGPRGLSVPNFSNFTMIFVFAFITVAVIRNTIASSHGRAMLAVRENELAADLSGVDTTRYKVTGFAMGAFFAGIAGGLLAHLIYFTTPSQFGFLPSAMILILVYAGGMGSLTGSMIAAFLLTFLTEVLRIGIDWLNQTAKLPIGPEWTMVVYALILILVMLFKPNGLMGGKEAKILILERKTT
ncbi:MAG TPA: branched-chain amino acid ABC transporter permease [Rectinemataceae bacterium]|nr:branched-chain amino acid ABC transporter permease [Rectinemataceae bacterium]